jgi:hypothetical protein
VNSINLQLERLRRHYEASVRTYDEVSLLDLSNALRIWTEVKTTLPKKYPGFDTTIAFKSATPTKPLIQQARGHRYVFVFMADGVITYAANGHLGSTPYQEEDFSMACKIKENTNGSLELSNFCWVSALLDGEKLTSKWANANISRGNYAQWMGAEVARLGYIDESGNLTSTMLSRENVIKRVANILQGSHASPEQTELGLKNRLDSPVLELMKFKMGGLPVPYFILLKTAQDILELAPKLLAKTKNHEEIAT